jgi:hypothetical protein
MKKTKYPGGATVSLLLSVVWLCGCGSTARLEPKNFVNSSVDVNDGAIHRARVQGMALDELMVALNRLAQKRELVLVRKFDCSETACKLEYKSRPENKSMNFSSTTTNTTGYVPYYDPMTGTYRPYFPGTTTSHTVKNVNLSYYSRFFLGLTVKDEIIEIEMVGVPVLNEEMSCPASLLQPYVVCQTPVVSGEKDIPLSSSFKRQWGYDISGAVEADVINGIFAELSLIVATPSTTEATANSGVSEAAQEKHAIADTDSADTSAQDDSVSPGENSSEN